MNKSIILHITGWVLCVEAAFMLLPCIIAIIYQEKSGYAFAITIGICLAIALPLILKKPKNKVFFAKEGFITVALGWITLSIIGALPFYFSREIPHFVDALFESVSGFTTTGSSILTDVEALSKCTLFWRSLSNWIGGMGVLVFILAIVPMSGGQGIHFMRAESPGPSVGKLVPKIRTSSKLLYLIYIGMTLLQIILLLFGGVPLFDSFTLAFSTAGTGGFSITNSSLAYYSTYIQIIVTIFMILFGINFNIYYILFYRRWKEALKSEELKWYLIIIVSSTILISLNIGGFGNFFGSIKDASFQVASIITTSGFSTVDFNMWPVFSQTILIILMFIGACAGSTGGGIKVSRIIILVKCIFKELSFLVHKRSVKVLKINNKKIEDETVRSVNVFFVTYVMIFISSLLIISLDNFDFTTNFSAIATTLNDVGPGLGIVGPTGNFSSFSYLSKFVFMFNMLAGRLELFPILLLFVPDTWKK